MRIIGLVAWIVAALAVAAGTYFSLRGQGDDAPPAAAIGGDYTLVDQDGRPASPDRFQGKTAIYYFGFANCPDICPASLATLSRALELLTEAERARVAPIFVSIDPERDTPEDLKRYLGYFDPLIVGLTGEPETIAETARAFGVYAKKIPLPDSALGYTMDHSSLFLVFDGRHRFLRPIDHATEPEAIAAILKNPI